MEFMPGRWLSSKEHSMVASLLVEIIGYISIFAWSSRFQIKVLRNEKIKFPLDFADFSEDDINYIVTNKEKISPPVTLQGILWAKLKQTCKFMGYLIQFQIILKTE